MGEHEPWGESPWEFRVEWPDLVGIYLTETNERVGEVSFFDDSAPFSEGVSRWRFQIDGGNSASGYMPRVSSSDAASS